MPFGISNSSRPTMEAPGRRRPADPVDALEAEPPLARMAEDRHAAVPRIEK